MGRQQCTASSCRHRAPTVTRLPHTFCPRTRGRLHSRGTAEPWSDGEGLGYGPVGEPINPATGAVLGRWAAGGEAEARAALAAARRAFDTSPWSRDRSLRHQALSEMADRFDARAEVLGPLLTQENRKNIAKGLFPPRSP